MTSVFGDITEKSISLHYRRIGATVREKENVENKNAAQDCLVKYAGKENVRTTRAETKNNVDLDFTCVRAGAVSRHNTSFEQSPSQSY